MNDDYDSPWKEAIETYFREFLELLFPVAAREIDWARGFEFLDQELRQVTREAETHRRTVDKLVSVRRLDGEETWVLIHIEVQGQWDAEFEARMFTCNYRIFDLFNRRVASFAVLSDENPNWRPNRFEYELWNSRMQFDFPAVKLLDYEARWEELEASPNLFAVVVMAHLKTQQTRHDNQSRYTWKMRLVRMLYERGIDGQNIRRLFHTIDWLMRLPKDLGRTWWQEFREFEEEQHMPFVTSVEEIGIEKGIEKGREEGREGMLRAMQRMLMLRFGAVPDGLSLRLTELNLLQLNLLLDDAFSAPSLEEFQARLPAADSSN